MNPKLWPLALANFVAGTGTFIVAGLLNEMSADLHVSVAGVGQLLAGYSLALAIGAPLTAWLTTRIDRRSLLATTMLAYALLHFAAALAPGFALLAAARVASGFVAAIVTPQCVATAALLVPPAARGRAITTVFLGFSMALVLGLPLGTTLGAAFGWRSAMGVVGLASLASAVWIRIAIPPALHVAPMDARAWRALAGNVAILWVIATTVVHAAGQFTLYTYLAPVFRASLGAQAGTIGLLFGWFGVVGVAGNIVAGRQIDRLGAPRVVAICLGLLVACFVLWPLTHGSLALTLVAILLWGLGCFAINASQQTRLMLIAPELASASVALNSSAIYLGQAAGSALGGLLIVESGYAALSWAGLALLLGACLTAWCAGRTSTAMRASVPNAAGGHG